MDDGPKFQTVLEPCGRQDLSDQLWSELVFGTSPKGRQTKLSVGVQGRFLEYAFPGMEELTDEGVIEPGLPFLNYGHLKAAIVSLFCVYWDGCPNIQVLGCFRWHAWAGFGAVVAAAVCVAGVALRDIDLHFAWQAWHLATWTCILRGRHGTHRTGLSSGGALGLGLAPWSPPPSAWQAWHFAA